MNATQTASIGHTFKHGYDEARELVANELTQATMLHTKAVTSTETANWKARCFSGDCYLGFPCPNGKLSERGKFDATTGFHCNCFVVDQIEEIWVPKLDAAIKLLSDPKEEEL